MMELQKEILDIVEEAMLIVAENNWGEKEIKVRAIYDTFRIQNAVKNIAALDGAVGTCSPVHYFNKKGVCMNCGFTPLKKDVIDGRY